MSLMVIWKLTLLAYLHLDIRNDTPSFLQFSDLTFEDWTGAADSTECAFDLHIVSGI